MKRGQITLFAIIGIIIVAAILLVLYLKGQINLPLLGTGTIQERLDDIKEHIMGCIEEVGDEPIKRIALQGGHLKTPEGTYRKKNDIPISYLCYNIPEKITCSNRLLLINDMEQELQEAIKLALSSCINLEQFRRGYDLEISNQKIINVTIGAATVEVTVHQPIIVHDQQTQVKAEDFTAIFNYPLGKLYDVSQDIVNTEASIGEFDQLSYMLAKRGQYIIQKDKPYPDKLYILQTKDNDYTFQFFIQGEPN